MTDTDHTDDQALLINIHAQTESLHHNLEQVAGGTDLYINTRKPQFMFITRMSHL